MPPVGDSIVHEPEYSVIDVGKETVILDVVLIELEGQIVTLYLVSFWISLVVTASIARDCMSAEVNWNSGITIPVVICAMG